jgi:predicted PurR-regulated permease PerM
VTPSHPEIEAGRPPAEPLEAPLEGPLDGPEVPPGPAPPPESPSGPRAPEAPLGQLGPRLALSLGGVFLLAILLIQLKVVLLPTVLAFLACCVLNPMVEAFRRRGLPRAVSVVLALAVGLGLIWLIFNYVVSSLTEFKDGFPRYAPNIQSLIDYVTAKVTDRFDLVTLTMIRQRLSSLSFGGVLSMLLNYVLTFAGHLTLTLLFILYFLPALPALPDKLRSAFPGERGQRLGRAMIDIIGQVQRYVLAKTLLSLALGLAVTLACHAFGVDFTTTWGVFAFFLNFIPNIGVPVATLPPVLVCLVQFGPASCLKLLAVLLALQLVHGNLVEPKVLGRSVDLSPTATLLALLVWGWIWGLIGMILAVPLMAVVKLACQNFPALRPAAALMGR